MKEPINVPVKLGAAFSFVMATFVCIGLFKLNSEAFRAKQTCSVATTSKCQPDEKPKKDECLIRGKTLFINGGIGQESLECLKRGEKARVRSIVMNSPGGYVAVIDEMVEIINKSKSINKLVCKQCSSAAAMIFTLVEVDRVLLKDSKLMYHEIYNKVCNLGTDKITADYAFEIYDNLRRNNDAMSLRISEKSNMSVEEYRAKVKTDWYVGPDEAIKLGLADKIE